MGLIDHHAGRFLPYLTSREVAHLPDKERAAIVLPLASIEQHGPHLPVFTDSIILEEVFDRALAILDDDCPVYFLPLQAYGKSNEHSGIAGTMTLSSRTLTRVISDIAESVDRSGFRRLVILNGHGGNTEIVDFIIRDIRERTGLMVFALHPLLRIAVPSEGLSDAEKVYGIHAGDVETSILLRCRPDLVHMELAPSSLPEHLQSLKYPPFVGPLNFAWLMPDISSSGVLGDATQAAPEKGEHFLSDAAAQVAELLGEIVDFRFAAE